MGLFYVVVLLLLCLLYTSDFMDRLLLLEDDSALLDGLQYVLRKNGYEAVSYTHLPMPKAIEKRKTGRRA